jgi:hypothetical protein
VAEAASLTWIPIGSHCAEQLASKLRPKRDYCGCRRRFAQLLQASRRAQAQQLCEHASPGVPDK